MLANAGKWIKSDRIERDSGKQAWTVQFESRAARFGRRVLEARTENRSLVDCPTDLWPWEQLSL